MKRQIRNTVIGARFLLVLAGTGAAALVIWLARTYPMALAAGVIVWLIGNGLVQAESWYWRRWSTLRRMEQQDLRK
ncbi:MAG: hypothetical protein Q3Y08_04985 [Butyricicoccus sp.]|nr:hypothetical protein [Butyricicoccus sp.]